MDDSPLSSLGIQQASRHDLPPAKRARVARYYETVRDDYFRRPQSWILDTDRERRLEE